MSRNPLTAAERSKILNLRRNGTSFANIAKELHRAKRTVVDFLKNSNSSTKTVKNEYKELKVTPKKETKTFIRVDYQKPQSEKSPTKVTDLEDEYNKVLLEHRAVIKFLTRKGENSKEIYTGMKNVYKEATPSIKAITYWSRQFRKGRETIVNEPKSKLESPKPSKPKVAKVMISKHMKNKIWVKRLQPKKAKSTGTLKLAKAASVNKMKVKKPPTDKLKKAVSSGKASEKRIGTEAKKQLITIKFPMLRRLKLNA